MISWDSDFCKMGVVRQSIAEKARMSCGGPKGAAPDAKRDGEREGPGSFPAPS